MTVTFGVTLRRAYDIGDDAAARGAQVAERIPLPDGVHGQRLAALWWSRVGQVFPLSRPTDDPGDPDGGKRPHWLIGHGHEAHEIGSQDPDQIIDWWTQEPMANVGITTRASGILLVDVDPRNGGWDLFLPWCVKNGVDLSDVPRSASPRGDGGQHLWWRLPDGASYPHAKLMTGVDRPWQVPVPPSYRYVETGADHNGTSRYGWRHYTWIAGDPLALPEAPEPLLGKGQSTPIGARRPADRNGDDPLPLGPHGIDEDSVPGLILPLGEQNFALKRLACSYIRRGRNDAWIGTTLMGIVAASPRDPNQRAWERTDIDKIIAYSRVFVEKKQREERAAMAENAVAGELSFPNLLKIAGMEDE